MSKRIKFRFENGKSNGCSSENKQVKIEPANKNAEADEQLFFISDIDKLETDIQKVAYAIDKKIIESEENALAFLSRNPERIPWYIERLKKQFEKWKSESR